MKNITIYYGSKKGFEKEAPPENTTLTELISMNDFKRNQLILKTEDNYDYKKEYIKNLVIYSEEYAGITESAIQNFISILNLYDIDNIYLQNPPLQISKQLEQAFKNIIKVKKFKYKKINKKMFLKINNTFSANIIGQENVKENILVALYNMMNSSNNKPIVIMLYGKSGVGKTETAKYISKVLGQDLFRKQFSMFHSGEFSSYLFGGNNSQSCFAKDLMERESNVILLDEFDKANHIFYSAFYQLFDEGIFEDKNYRVDLNNSIIICTSNYNSENEIRDHLGDPIFYRFHKFIKFNDLTNESLITLINKIVDEKYNRLKKSDKEIINVENLKKILCDNVHKLNNARQISNIVDDYIGKELVNVFINTK